jgi:hypothetical protein
MRGHRRNAETRAVLEAGAGGQAHGALARHHGVFGGRTEGPAALRHVEPDTLADALAVDPGADLVDRAGAVLVRHDAGKGDRPAAPAAAALGVGGVDRRNRDPDAHFARSRLGRRHLADHQHVTRRTGLLIPASFHGLGA